MHRRAVERDTQRKQRRAEREAKLRLRAQQPFGRKAEAASPPALPAPTTPDAAPRRPRGQQAGRPGHGRRDYRPLPATVGPATRSGAGACCPRCHQPFPALGGTAGSTVLEVVVRAPRRIVRRRR